jgi:hypothetical protein
MYGHEIVSFFQRSPELLPYFDGVFAVDTLPRRLKERHCFIFNSSKQSEVGTHWIAVANNNAHSNTKNTLEVFDSLSVNKDFINRHLRIRNMTKFKRNETVLQSPESSLCGEFCIWFCANRLENPEIEYSKLLNVIFDVDLQKNDVTVSNFLKQF